MGKQKPKPLENCCEPGCHRSRGKRSRRCNTCKDKLWRARHPERYAFKNLRNNAKNRGIKFSLTFEDFLEFCVETEILKNRGRTAESYHIDRINDTDPEIGYCRGNIQKLTCRENVEKENNKRKAVKRKTLSVDPISGDARYFTTGIEYGYTPPAADSECPF